MLQLLKKEVFEPLQEASLLRPTQKTVFLVTLATAARVSEIHALSASAECLRFIDNGSVSLLTSPGFFARIDSQSWAARLIPCLPYRGPVTLPCESLAPVCSENIEHASPL